MPTLSKENSGKEQRLFDCFAASAGRYADRVAIETDDRALTYRQLEALADRFAKAFLAAGVRRGDRVGVLMANCPEWPALWWALTRIGAGLVAINPKLADRERAAIAADARLTCLIGDQITDKSAFDSALPAERIISFVPTADEAFLAGGDDVSDAAVADRAAEVSLDDCALVVYTSGTTGLPKGVVLTHRNIVRGITRQNVWFEAGPETRMLCAMPFAHVGGATESVAATLMSGGRLILLGTFDPAAVLERIERRKVSVYGGVPTMYAMLLACPDLKTRDLSSLRRLLVAGAPLSEPIARGMRTLAPIVQTGYGMTEAAGFVTYTAPDDPPQRVLYTVGRIDETFELRIVDNGRKSVAEGEVGEVALRGDCITPGYLFNEEATAAVLDSDGWYYSGDLGCLDAGGYLHLAGRKKEMYITGGYNVYPAEVEAHLEEHPAVSLAACIGVPDEKMGEVGWAFVLSLADPPATEEQLDEHARAGLARYKVPARYIIRNQLPLTALGKIDKQALRREVDSLR